MLLPLIIRRIAFPLLVCLLLAAPAAHAAQTTQTTQTILVFGDSLSAGYGIRQDAAWPSLLAAAVFWPEALARPAGVLIVLAQGALLLVLRHALATCREHEAKLAALPPAQEAR